MSVRGAPGSRAWASWVLRLAWVAALGAGREAQACPFCAWMGGRAPSVQRLLAESPVLAVATPKEGRAGSGIEDPAAPRLLELRVLQAWRGPKHLPAGGAFEAEVVGNPRPGARYLASGAPEDVATGALRLRPLSPDGAEILGEYVSLHDRPVTTVGDAALGKRERLAFFLPHLKHGDPVVAEAAYFEFSEAAYPELLPLRDRIDPDRVLAWLDDAGAPYNRGLLFLLVGISGSALHRDRLASLLDGPVDPRPGLDGLLGAYLLLAGAEGLPRVQARLDAVAATSDARRFAVAYVAALRFHETETKTWSSSEIGAAYRRLLRHPALADLALVEMLRLRDWGDVSSVVALWRQHGAARPFLDAAARAWLRACPAPTARAAREEAAPSLR